MKTTLATVLVLVLVPGLAAAQNGTSSPSRFELRGSGGWIGFADDSLINHALAGVSLRIRLTKGLGVEPEVSYLVGPGEDRDIVFMPVVSYEFGSKRVKPYVLGGAGVLWHRDSFLRSYSSPALHASGGFGVRTQVTDRWSVSPEFRAGLYFHLQFKVGVGYQF
jgi:hypothetical protein